MPGLPGKIAVLLPTQPKSSNETLPIPYPPSLLPSLSPALSLCLCEKKKYFSFVNFPLFLSLSNRNPPPKIPFPTSIILCAYTASAVRGCGTFSLSTCVKKESIFLLLISPSPPSLYNRKIGRAHV